MAKDQLDINQCGICSGWKTEEFLLILRGVYGSVLANEIHLKAILTRRVCKVEGLFYLTQNWKLYFHATLCQED